MKIQGYQSIEVIVVVEKVKTGVPTLGNQIQHFGSIKNFVPLVPRYAWYVAIAFIILRTGSFEKISQRLQPFIAVLA